jgi:glycyl-tRNA synthetase beta chain
MVAELLLEIGTEEIPAGYLEPGLKAFRELALTCLAENRIEVAGGIYTFGTPRRLVLIGKAIAGQQEDLVQEITGPPKKVAYDADGKPTRAAVAFAEKYGIAVEALECIETPKGEYLYARSHIPGRPTRDILAGALPELIAKIPWPKSMRWGMVQVPFVRPVHWVVALINGEVIPFEFANIHSGNVTWGHRFMKPDPIQVFSVQGYLSDMKEAWVLIDQSEREELVEQACRKAAQGIGGRHGDDPELRSTVANLVEYPSAVCGSFDPEFLKIPDAVLIEAMKKHQKYFAVYDSQSRLMPNFVAINNTVARDESVVRKGHERVLRARLSDANFFYTEDRKRPLLDRLDDLKGVIYQADLGTSHAKVERFMRLAEYLAEKVLPDQLENVRLAARLCKCDLVTLMVGEFPTLQGVMGEAYARVEGYADEVCRAIRDHYLPDRAGGLLPGSRVGALISLADRMDTIVGCFAVGLTPTGNTDPFALRRHALAIIRILEDMELNLSLTEFIAKAISLLSEHITFDSDAVSVDVTDFFRERYRYMLLREGYAADPVMAVISVNFDRICGLRGRIDQLKKFTEDSTEFQALSLTFKRITNILKKQGERFCVAPERFQDASETALWKACCSAQKDIYTCLDNNDYYGALTLMVGLWRPVDDFFEAVEIMAKDEKLRENRVGLLQYLLGLFLSVADFSKFSV